MVHLVYVYPQRRTFDKVDPVSKNLRKRHSTRNMINNILTLSHSIKEPALHRYLELSTYERTVIISKLTEITEVLVKMSKGNKDLQKN